MKNVTGLGLCLLLLLVFGSPKLAQAATEDDLFNAAAELIGEDDYAYFDHEGTTVDVDGYRIKSWGTNGDLTDSGGGHGWTENNEFVETLTGLQPSISYKLYVLAGGRVSGGASENWGVRVGFETGVYTLATPDIADADESLVRYNLGEYNNGSSYPYRETQGDVNAACMYAVYVGGFVADANGEMTVYVDNVNDVDIDGAIGERTWYDGLLYAPILEAYDPMPEDGQTQVDINSSLSWTSPGPGFTFDVYFGTEEPNALQENYGASFTKLNGETQLTEASIEIPMTLDYSTEYYWVVDSYQSGSSTAHQGDSWSFTTVPFDTAPAVTAGSSYITWVDNMPQDIDATVDDNEEDDIADADVVWTIATYAGDPIPETMQMLDRGMNSSAAQALDTAGYDPNMLSDWIGTDSRQNDCDLIVMTLSGLPAGEYTWTSTHHDLNDQSHLFDVYVGDVLTDTEIDITNGDQVPAEYTTTLTSDGTNPVTISFKAYPQADGLGYGSGFFIMNAFELTDGVNTMKVDFGIAESGVAVGYEAYVAVHEEPDTFTAQDFAFGADTVTVLPLWGPKAAGWIDASLTKTSTDPLLPTASFTTNYPGTYVIELTATDDTVYGPDALSDSATLEIVVADDACAAAQMSSSWDGFDYYDVDDNCVIDLFDFAEFSVKWLEDKSLTVSEAF